MRILHAIHDFLPAHAAGSEIYAFHLCRELASRHVVHVVAAEYDPSRLHGALSWRVHDGLPVIELVNNWHGPFADTWRSPRISGQLAEVLRAVQPDVLHVHSLFNLSFDLPMLARAANIPVVATLHDYTLVCPGGGQRLHLTERTVCETIEPARCAGCFSNSALHAQMSVAAALRAAGPARPWVGRAARWMARNAPRASRLLARTSPVGRAKPVSEEAVAERLAALREVFDAVQIFVAPSAALASEYERLGLPASKLRVSDYGFIRRPSGRKREFDPSARVRIGFAGTLVWHKGVHVLLEAARDWPPDRFEIEIWGRTDTFPEYAAHLKSLARGLPVRFCGGFANREADRVYDRLDVLVVPSLWPENSPLVIHEAFMSGVPVVTTNLGGNPELVTDGVNGVLYDASPSPEPLAAAMRQLLDHPAAIGEMARAVPPVKTIEQDAREWEQRYEEAAAGAGGAARDDR